MNIPPVTKAMVDAALSKIAYMLTNTDPGELKGTLAHFVERIEVEGAELTFFYSFAKPVAGIMPSTGDPEGSVAVGIMKTRLTAPSALFARSA